MRRLRILLLLATVACLTNGRKVERQSQVVLSGAEPALLPHLNESTYPVVALTSRVQDGGDAKVQLRLCECERATGAPNGLSCDKEGWFVSSWEKQGQWVAGGGFVPLSHAICCRPCLPNELPPDSSGRIPAGQSPLAIISLGCHPSTDTLLSRCEAGAGSFVVGFSEAVKVFTTPDTYYPINRVQCCTPALLLENGDAWELERCGCHDSPDADFPVNCGGTHTDELLLGYSFFRLSPLGHAVPVGPAQCCKVCLSGTVHPMNECSDLNSCSGHGVCNLRQCECFEGWTGADCGQAAHNSKGIPPWAIALIVLSSSAIAGILIIAAGYALQALGLAPRTPALSDDEDGEERQPLLIRLDADDAGSVGSADTTECEEGGEAEEVERRVTRVIQRLQHAAAGAEGQAAAELSDPTTEQAGDNPPGARAGAASQAAPTAAQQPSSSPAPEQQTVAAASHAPAADAQRNVTSEQAAAQPEGPALAARQESSPVPGVEDESEQQKQSGHNLHQHAEGPLGLVQCSVCLSRPVQVALIPCGHVCMCRRCSRRLNRCPICRKDIARRQRLYV